MARVVLERFQRKWKRFRGSEARHNRDSGSFGDPVKRGTTLAIVEGMGRGLLWVLCLLVALASYRFVVLGVEASMEFVAYHSIERPIAFYAHVFLAPLALALVPFQLWTRLRKTRPHLHRISGRAYGFAILVSGVAGLWLAATTIAGPVAAWGFGLLAFVWVGTTVRGIMLAMAGDYAGHRRWMIRSIALTLAAVTLRIYIPASMEAEIPFSTAYPVIAWLCWVPNLLAAELIIARRPALRFAR